MAKKLFIFYDFQVGLGDLYTCRQKVFNMNNDVCFIGFDGNLTFNTAEFAFDNFYFMPNSKNFAIKADTVRIPFAYPVLLAWNAWQDPSYKKGGHYKCWKYRRLSAWWNEQIPNCGLPELRYAYDDTSIEK